MNNKKEKWRCKYHNIEDGELVEKDYAEFDNEKAAKSWVRDHNIDDYFSHKDEGYTKSFFKKGYDFKEEWIKYEPEFKYMKLAKHKYFLMYTYGYMTFCWARKVED